MIDARLAAARLTAVLRAAMTHGNKIRPLAIAPGHRRIPDFSPSFQAVYSSDRRLPSTTVRGEEASDGFRRGERVGGGPDDRLGLSRLERRWRSIVGDDWPQPRMTLADVAIGSVSNR
jgi:hypothetical protein